MKQQLDQIKAIFEAQGHAWVEPYATTEGAINRGEVGNHRGLYYIYPEVNFYFGKAATNTVINRHQTHRPKLDCDLATLYGPVNEKKEPRWQFPEGFKEGVCKYLLENVDSIPAHWIRIRKGLVGPGVIDFPVKHRVNVDTLPVLVWNLEHLSAEEISKIEDTVIPTIWPYCNNETYLKRKREKKI